MASAKGYKGLGMEGPIAGWYAETTARDAGRFDDMVRAIGARVRPGADILEVAPGPGYLAVRLAQRGYSVSAVDISKSFVKMVRENAAKAGVTIDVTHGNASALPFPDKAFDFLVCSAAFKNFSDPVGALNEAYRVLKPGGEVSIYDLRKDASIQEIDQEVGKMNLSAWNRFTIRMTFRFMLLPRAYTREQFERMARESRFAGGEAIPMGIGIELRLKK